MSISTQTTITQTELNRQAVARAQLAIAYYRMCCWPCEGEGDAALGLMSDLFQWAQSHGGSTEELRNTAYGNFLHDEAIEQEEAAAL